MRTKTIAGNPGTTAHTKHAKVSDNSTTCPCSPHSPVPSSLGASSAVRQHAIPQHPKPMSVPGGNWTSVYAQQHLPTTSQQPRSCDQQGSGSQLQQQGSHCKPTEPAQQQTFMDDVQIGSQHWDEVHDCSKQKHATHEDMFCFNSLSSFVDVISQFNVQVVYLCWCEQWPNLHYCVGP